MAARRWQWVLAAILATSAVVAGQTGESVAANRGQSILSPPDGEDAVIEPPDITAGAPAQVVNSEPLAVDAAEDSPIPPRGETEDGRISKSEGKTDPLQWWQTLGALILVIGLIFCAKWILGRYGGNRGRGRNAGVIEVLSKTAVSARHSVMLIRVGSRLLVVGAGSDGMNTLAEISDPEQVSEVLGAIERSRATSLTNSFRRALRRERADFGDETTAPDPGLSRTAAGGAADRIKGLLGRLRNMGSTGRGSV